MSISEKKQELGGGGIREKPGKTPLPKEEKKDTSVFGGKTQMSKSDFIRQSKDQRFYKATGLGEKERTELGRKLFEGYGSHFDPGEVREVKRQLELGKYGKFKDLSLSEKEKAEKLIEEISGE